MRQSQSAWGFVNEAAAERAVARLRADLDSGAWDRRYGALRRQPEFAGSLRLITAAPADQSLGGHTGIWPRPDGNRMFFERTNSCSVSTAFSRPKPLPFTPPNGEPRNARRM